MENLVQVHMIPTDKSILVLTDGKLRITKHAGHAHQGQHLYITTENGDIKDGDWFIHNGELLQADEIKISSGFRGMFAKNDPSYWIYEENLKNKIVATTNFDISYLTDTYNRNHEIEKMWEDYPPIPYSFIELYVSCFNKGNPIKQVKLKYKKYTCIGYCDVKAQTNGEGYCEESCISNKLELNYDGSVQLTLLPPKEYKWKELKSIAYECYKKGIDQGLRPTTTPFETWFNATYPE